MTVSGEDVRAAQTLTGMTFALFMMVGFVPGWRPYAQRIRQAIVVLYFVLAAAFMVYLMAR